MANLALSMSSTLTTATDSSGKPVKLRAACNSCFSAKVRCEGNKEGCQRCVEKQLSCVYSESRVGKVVGRRRKRPLDESIGTITSEGWVVNPSRQAIASIPSPTTTHCSLEYSNKRHCSEVSWSSFLVDEQQDFISTDETSDALYSIDMSNKAMSVCSEYGFSETKCGLPTPSLSPPQFAYLTPSTLEARPMSRQPSLASILPNRLAPPRYPASISHTPEPTHPEDQETVCIKLLAHLKKSSQCPRRRTEQLELLKKSNAVIRRILRSKSVKCDYSVQLLLSSILTHIVALCEIISTQPSEQVVPVRPNQGQGEQCSDSKVTADPAKVSIVEASALIVEVGDLLKRKPLNGFQTLGRHESHHVELDLRLQRVMIKLDS